MANLSPLTFVTSIMAKFRYQDQQQTTEHGQILGFANCMGSLSLAHVRGVVCDDGVRRNWFKTAEPDTFFSVPGYVRAFGKKVHGFMSSSDGPYKFREESQSNHNRVIPLLHPGDESSHASLRDCDVASGILDLCKRRSVYLATEKELEIIVRHEEVLSYLPDAEWNDHRLTWHSSVLAEPYQIIADAMDELNQVCPKGYYFGSHPGDGSLFGVWQCEEE